MLCLFIDVITDALLRQPVSMCRLKMQLESDIAAAHRTTTSKAAIQMCGRLINAFCCRLVKVKALEIETSKYDVLRTLRSRGSAVWYNGYSCLNAHDHWCPNCSTDCRQNDRADDFCFHLLPDITWTVPLIKTCSISVMQLAV